MTAHETRSARGDGIARHITVGLIAILILVGGIGGWSAYASLSAAVIAAGQVVVSSNVKQIQHPYGGVVDRIAVEDGDRVEAGDLLFSLDETITAAERAVVVNRLSELQARKLRLEAERTGGTFSAKTAAEPGLDDNGIVLSQKALETEERVFKARDQARNGRKAQLTERVGQLEREIEGLDAQIAAKTEEVRLVEQELADMSTLIADRLIPASRITALKRETTRLQGERGALIAQLARTQGQVSETQLQSLQIEEDLQTEVTAELRDLDSEMTELLERRIASDERLQHMTVFAPISGTVHESDVHTVGGVLRTAETVMQVVPSTDTLTIEARIPPANIDQVQVGQAAAIRLSAFNQRTTPELAGRVSRIAADASEDERTGITYFTVRIALPEQEIARLNGLELLPGMPVEAFIQTEARTALNYFTKPISDQLRHALREE